MLEGCQQHQQSACFWCSGPGGSRSPGSVPTKPIKQLFLGRGERGEGLGEGGGRGGKGGGGGKGRLSNHNRKSKITNRRANYN